MNVSVKGDLQAIANPGWTVLIADVALSRDRSVLSLFLRLHCNQAIEAGKQQIVTASTPARMRPRLAYCELRGSTAPNSVTGRIWNGQAGITIKPLVAASANVDLDLLGTYVLASRWED